MSIIIPNRHVLLIFVFSIILFAPPPFFFKTDLATESTLRKAVLIPISSSSLKNNTGFDDYNMDTLSEGAELVKVTIPHLRLFNMTVGYFF